jgi:hypothetical protein
LGNTGVLDISVSSAMDGFIIVEPVQFRTALFGDVVLGFIHFEGLPAGPVGFFS